MGVTHAKFPPTPARIFEVSGDQETKPVKKWKRKENWKSSRVKSCPRASMEQVSCLSVDKKSSCPSKKKKGTINILTFTFLGGNFFSAPNAQLGKSLCRKNLR